MRKVSSLIVALVILACGCSPTENWEDTPPIDVEPTSESQPVTTIEPTAESQPVTPINWIIPKGTTHISESYINQLLIEKGLPYSINFIEKGEKDERDYTINYLDEVLLAKENGEEADLIFSGYGWVGSVDEPIGHNIIAEGVYLPLDDFLKTELGDKLRGAYHDLVWESFETDGSVYGVSCNKMSLWRKAVVYNAAMAEKYEIDPARLAQPLWDLEPLLAEILEGESDNPDFRPVQWSHPLSMMPDYTMISSTQFLFCDETSGDTRAENIYDTEEMRMLWDTAQDFQSKGYMQTMEQCMQSLQNQNPEDTFMSYDIIMCPTYFERVFDGTGMAYVPIGEYVYADDFNYANIGVASWCTRPEDAFSLLASIMSDPSLSNAFTWGLEGTNYSLVDGRAVKTGLNGITFPYQLSGNEMISYPGFYEPVDKQSEFDSIYSNAKKSKLFGFYFDRRGIADVFTSVFDLNDNLSSYLGEEDPYAIPLADIVESLNDAGMGEILEEANRQIKEWEGEAT